MQTTLWLTTAQAKQRQEKFWLNVLPQAKKKTIFSIMLSVVKEPMIFLLIVCSTLYLFLWDIQEAIILLISIGVIITITIYQENKTEKALEALKDLSSPRALVIRDGKQIRIPWSEVTIDDIVILEEGDKVPADCIILEAHHLSIDESLLTGESIAVQKSESKDENTHIGRPWGNNTPFAYSWTLVIKWTAIAKVVAIGSNTEMGRIGTSLKGITIEKTLLQKEVKKVITVVFIVAISFCIILFLIYAIKNHDWVKWLLASLTLAMGILPEEFPIVLTVFLAIGAWRMSKKKVLTRRMNAIQMLWSTTVLCSDKTGTITENNMKVVEIIIGTTTYKIENKKNIPEDVHELIEYALLANEKDPFDPMEIAIKDLQKKIDKEHIHERKLVKEYPLSNELLAVSHLYSKTKGSYVLGSKWAPEAIMRLCKCSPKERKEIEKQVQALAEQWLRVLWVAKAESKSIPEKQTDITYTFIWLLWLKDPIRAQVPQAIKECYKAGVRVIMITGDYPITAKHIADEIGIQHTENILTGDELRTLPKMELEKRIKITNLYARILPEEKLIIVNALKKQQEIVAMTGDGINDAPALKAAHIGVAMGLRWTDVAREAAGIVLLDDNFTSMVHGIRMGRRIFDNLRKAMNYLISVHVPIAGIALIPVLSWGPIILFPIHIVFLEFLIDPSCSVVFESEEEESNIMNRPPRNPKEHILSRKVTIISLLQWALSLGWVIFAYLLAQSRTNDETIIRAMTFTTLVVGNIALIITNRSWSEHIWSILKKKNKAFTSIIPLAFWVLLITVFLPAIRNFFYFGNTPIARIGIAVLIWCLSVLWFEIIKLFLNRKTI